MTNKAVRMDGKKRKDERLRNVFGNFIYSEVERR